MMKIDHIMFLDKYKVPIEQIKAATTTICDFKREQTSIEAVHKVVLIAWMTIRKEWELELVFRAWDQKTVKFLLYVTSCNELGNKDIIILVKWAETLYYQPVPYCGHCLKLMDLFCTLC